MSRSSFQGLTVTLVGADGAGKSTVSAALQSRSSRPVTCVYMGANPAAATHMLLTTRLWLASKRVMGGKEHVSGPPDIDSLRKRPSSSVKRARGHVKSLIHLGVYAPEEVYRQCVSWWAESRGRLVVQDRHPLLDYYASDVLGQRGWRRIGDRLHGFLIRRLYRGPGRVLLLDAPAEILFARKSEGTLRSLRARRDEYLALRTVMNDLHVIDVDRPIEAVLDQVSQLTGESRPANEPLTVKDCTLPATAGAEERAAQVSRGQDTSGVPELLELLTVLQLSGVSVWLNRGWGVDALVGFATRPHRDVDLVTVPGALDKLGAALTSAGYAPPVVTDGHSAAGRIEFVSPAGLCVEIRESAETLDAGFGAIGHLNGIEVPCVDAERQLNWRVGRKLTHTDMQAIELLQDTAGAALPHELRPFGKARVSYRARRLARTAVTLGEPDGPTPHWVNKLRQR